MKSALERLPLQRLSLIWRQASGWQGFCDREEVQGNGRASIEGVCGLKGSVRRYVATSPLWKSFISSKYSRIESKRDRKRVGEVKSNSKGSESRVLHGPNLAFKALNDIGLTDSTKAVVLGSLLGDCSLRIVKGENDARLLFRVSEVDKEYFHWKAAALKEISSSNSVHLGASNKFLFQSRAVDSLTKIYEVTHNKEELLIRKRWLNHFTAQSLAVWWCDAGSLVARGRKGEICTDLFSEDRVLVLSRYLEDEWKVRSHVGQFRLGKEAFIYKLSFRTEELKKFLRIVLPHIPVASMLWKCVVVNHSDALQESWISEMKAAVPHFSTFIDEELLKRLSFPTFTHESSRTSQFK